MQVQRRFLTLEAMRGLAAVCVVLVHGNLAFGAASPVGGFLAVDFFFLLSGFIMAHAYEGELDRGLPRRSFLRRRLIRLYPLYLVGTLSTVVLAVMSIVFLHQDGLWVYTRPLVSLPLAVWMLPNPMTQMLFPLDVPAWTLFMELVANVAFAFGAWRRTPSLLVTIGLAAIVLMVSVERYGTLDFGWKLATAGSGLARVFFSFPLGVFLYRVRHHIRLPAVFGVASPLALVALLYCDPAEAWRRVFDLAFVAVAAPWLVLTASSREPADGWLRRVYVFLGMISYPLYVLHHPSLIAAIGALDRHVPPGPAFAAGCCAVVAGLIVAAWVAAVVDRNFGLAYAARRRRRAAALGVA